MQSNRTMSTRETADYIKARITMPGVIGQYHHPGKHRWRTVCPIHGGEHENLGYDAHTFHCFTCGAKGDVIDFVMQLHGMDFPDTVKLLDRDFSLGLYRLDGEAVRTAREAAARREAEAEEERRRCERNRKAFILFARYRRWLESDAAKRNDSRVHEFQLAWCDRMLDSLTSDRSFDIDPKAAIRASVGVLKRGS